MIEYAPLLAAIFLLVGLALLGRVFLGPRLTSSSVIPLLSSGSFLLGLAGLTYMDKSASLPPNPWHYFLFELFALLGSVGLVGLFFEYVVRRKLFAELEQELRSLYYLDPKVLEKLKLEERGKLVQCALQSHLGDEGKAIYDNLLHRYFDDDEKPFRREVLYDVAIRNLTDDISIGQGSGTVVLGKDRYYQLTTRYRFKRLFKWSNYRSVGCILDRDAAELNYWFGRADCIFREVAYLEEPDRKKMIDLLQNLHSEDLFLSIASLFKIEVKVNEQTAQIDQRRTKLSESKKSVEIDLKMPRAGSGDASLEISTVSIIAKSTHQYPVILVEPSLSPKIEFSWDGATDIKKIEAGPFFTMDKPFSVKVSPSSIQRRITISVPEDHWVFPSSGAAFTWYYQ